MDYLVMLLTVLSWGLYAMFVYHMVAGFRRRQQQGRERARMLGFWLMLWAVLAGGLLVYLSVYPVGIAGMVWVAVNGGLVLPEMGQHVDESPESDRKLVRTAVWMTLFSSLCLALGWPLALLFPGAEMYKYVTVLVAMLASVMFILALAGAWRRFRHMRANVTEQ